MCASILGFQAPLLRAIADQLQLPPVAEIARQPGAHEVCRITVQYFDGRACNSVATLRGLPGSGNTLEVVYQRALLRKPLKAAMSGGCISMLHRLWPFARFNAHRALRERLPSPIHR